MTLLVWIGTITLILYFLDNRFGLVAFIKTLIEYISKPSKPGQIGLTSYQKWKQFKPSNRGFFIDGKAKRLSRSKSYRGVAIIGSTGSGKTRNFVIPNAEKLDDCSIVITDPSGEILAKTKDSLLERGFKILQFNLVNPEKSNTFNPLTSVKSKMKADEIAEALVSATTTAREKEQDMFWLTGAIDMISFCIQLIIEEKGLATLPEVYQTMQQIGSPMLIEKRLLNIESQSIRNQFQTISALNPRVSSSFLAVANNALRLMANEEIAQILSKNDIEFELFRKEKTALFIITPTDRISLYAPLVSMLYTHLFRAFMSRLPYKDEYPVFILLDEFANLTPNISDFDNILTTCRKYFMAISIILQSTSQLKWSTNTILEGGINTRLHYGALDSATRRFIYQTSKLDISGVSSNKVLFINSNFAPQIIRTHTNRILFVKKLLRKLIDKLSIIKAQMFFKQKSEEVP